MKTIFLLSLFFSVLGFFGTANDAEAQPYAGSGWCPTTGCEGSMRVSGPFGACPGNLVTCPVSGQGCMMGQSGTCCAQSTAQEAGWYSYVCESSGGGNGNDGGTTCSSSIPKLSYSCNATGTQATLSITGSSMGNIYALRIDDPTTRWTGACPAPSPDFCGNITGNTYSMNNIVPGRTYAVRAHSMMECGGYGLLNPTPGSIKVTCSPPPPPAPVPDLRINGSDGPLAVSLGANLNLTWGPVANATSCTATAGSGWAVVPKNQNGGNDNIPATVTSTYTLSCTGAGGTGSDSVVVTVNAPPPPPLAVPVISHVCNAAGTSVTLNYGVPTATAYYLRIDQYTGTNSSWDGSCAAPDRCIDATASPSYSGPVLPGVTYGSWVYAYRGSESKHSAYYTFQCNAPTLTVGVTATPASGTAPLNSTVTASVGGSATGTINYHFYCDGANLTQSYLAQPTTSFSHVCSYPVAGTYAPRVLVERGAALPIAGSATVIVGAPPACTGPVPGLASLCSGDDSGLLANTPRTLVASCSVPAGSNPKCQYSCTSPATYNASANRCELCGVCGSASDHCEGERWADNCGNANVCGPGTKDCRQFWREVAP